MPEASMDSPTDDLKDDPIAEETPPANPNARAARGPRRPREPMTEKACLAAIETLAALVAAGALTAAQANSMRGSYMAILAHHRQSRSATGGGGLPDSTVAQLLKQNPDLLNVLEPLLSGEQIARALAPHKDDAGG